MQAAESCDGLDKVDLVVLLVKSFDTETAIRKALPIIGTHTLVLSLQNGLGHETILEKIVGRPSQGKSLHTYALDTFSFYKKYYDPLETIISSCNPRLVEIGLTAPNSSITMKVEMWKFGHAFHTHKLLLMIALTLEK